MRPGPRARLTPVLAPVLAPALAPALALVVLALVLAVAAAGVARAAPFQPGEVFDQEQVSREITLAMGFMAPRILEPLPVAQLTLWGLRGLTTLDPRLKAANDGGVLDLTISTPDGGRLLASLRSPAEQDAAGWGQTASALLRAGWNASLPVRRAGEIGLIHTFFDEVFNHLDPYSRYVSPEEAADEDLDAPAPPAQDMRASRAGALLLVRVPAFTSDTGARLQAEIGRALGVGGRRIRGLVIDLRGNRGGLLDQAADAAAALLDEGVVATTAGRDPQADHVFRAEGGDVAHGLPTVLMVDGRSASAAEILTAALADQHRAVVVGSATLGKGLVQTIMRLPDGGALYVTWSRVLAPLGWPIQGLGVLPQVCTSLGEDATRGQLAELDAGRQPMARALARNRDARAPVPAAEALEIRSACPAAEGRDLDLAAARYLIEHRAAYDTALIGPPR